MKTMVNSTDIMNVKVNKLLIDFYVQGVRPNNDANPLDVEQYLFGFTYNIGYLGQSQLLCQATLYSTLPTDTSDIIVCQDVQNVNSVGQPTDVSQQFVLNENTTTFATDPVPLTCSNPEESYDATTGEFVFQISCQRYFQAGYDPSGQNHDGTEVYDADLAPGPLYSYWIFTLA